MSYEIHGHAVLDLILASGRTFDRASLIDYVERHFGTEVRFCTCSAAGLDAAALIDLLTAKGKFRGSPHAFTVDTARVCRH